MIANRHLGELETAVRVARRAVTVGRLDRPEPLTRFLHERWYLGLTSPQAEVPAARAPWQAWGPRWTADLDDGGPDLVRLHLSAAPRTVLHALALIAARAGQWDHPWRLTSTALASGLPVPESTVLAVPVDSLLPLRPAVESLVDELRPFLALGVPALTLRIGRGAALAQDPAGGCTFGEHRCGIVAGAVLGSMRQHPREQVARTMAAFAEAGVDPERPYLEQQTSWDRPWRAA
jgi:hypothetical protein